MMLDIQCLGAGVMSSAFAHVQAGQHRVRIYPTPFDQKVCELIRSEGCDSRFEAAWPERLTLENELYLSADLIVIGVSSAGIDWAIDICNQFSADKQVVLLTKGLIAYDGVLQPISAYVRNRIKQHLYAITGPCIASELANGSQTYVEISGSGSHGVTELSKLLSATCLHVQTYTDIDAACWLAALKNVYAIIIGAHSASTNEKSRIFTEAALELEQWLQLKSLPANVLSLSGIGDLMVTAETGRNGRFGRYLSQGLTREAILMDQMRDQTVEGLNVLNLINKYEDISSFPLVQDLMQRL